jgi:hypothetical protein
MPPNLHCCLELRLHSPAADYLLLRAASGSTADLANILRQRLNRKRISGALLDVTVVTGDTVMGIDLDVGARHPGCTIADPSVAELVVSLLLRVSKVPDQLAVGLFARVVVVGDRSAIGVTCSAISNDVRDASEVSKARLD